MRLTTSPTMKIVKCTLLSIVIATTSAVGQSGTPTSVVDRAMRDATINALVERVAAGYVLPENAERVVQALRSANRAGEYTGKTPREFVDAVNGTLLNASQDKHLKVFYQPVTVPSGAGAESSGSTGR